RHVFAEVVDADGHAEGVGGRGDGEGVLDAQACDEATRHSAADAGALRDRAQHFAFRERDENRSKHQALAAITAQTREAFPDSSSCAHARSVSAVVQMSSTIRIERPRTADDAWKTPRTFPA